MLHEVPPSSYSPRNPTPLYTKVNLATQLQQQIPVPSTPSTFSPSSTHSRNRNTPSTSPSKLSNPLPNQVSFPHPKKKQPYSERDIILSFRDYLGMNYFNSILRI